MTADHYVAAVPVEIMRTLAGPELRAAEPRLKRLDRLVTRWMNGVMFYLDEDVPVVTGHAIYIDSEWALTSISQRQFWRGYDLEQTGDGRVEGILSVDVSDWAQPSRRLGKIAMQCSHDEVIDEVRRSSPITSQTSTGRMSCARSSTPRSSSRTRPRPPTSSRCWSTPRTRGRTARTR